MVKILIFWEMERKIDAKKFASILLNEQMMRKICFNFTQRIKDAKIQMHLN